MSWSIILRRWRRQAHAETAASAVPRSEANRAAALLYMRVDGAFSGELPKTDDRLSLCYNRSRRANRRV